jgi:branched-chain amino acid transport system permease protein
MLAQQLANGLVLGATYALFAIGFTLIFGVLGVINLAYGFYFCRSGPLCPSPPWSRA